MRSVNKAILVGNLGADPDVRSTQGGTRVANLSVATSRNWKDRQGQKQEKTEWHRVVLWDKLAEIGEKYLSKGDSIYIEGEIEYRQYEDKDGVTKYMTEIRARELVMLGSWSGEKREPQKAATPAASYDDFPSDFPEEDDDLPF